MPPMARKRDAKTYLPSEDTSQELHEFLTQIEHFANRQTRLTSSDGVEVLLPEPLFDVLRRVADALAAGNGVTVMPQAMKLTTQQAADVLGTSRPTLIKLLESEAIPYELVGRHRRVTLSDLNDYRDRAKAERRALLRRTAREGQDAGLMEVGLEEMPDRV